MNMKQSLRYQARNSSKTQRQLADEVGCDESQMSRFLNTGCGLSADRVCKLATILNEEDSMDRTKMTPKSGGEKQMAFDPSGKASAPYFSAQSWVGKGESATDIVMRARRQLKQLGDDPIAKGYVKALDATVTALKQG